MAAKALGRMIQTRRSGVHGKGVFAVQDIPAGETLIEYVGEIISWKEALRRHPHDPKDPNHTFYFHIDDGRVIDAKHGGNSSRWINHSCDPNCEADEQEGRVFIKALRNIRAGEELNYDYGLTIDEPFTPELLAEYPCWCGSKNCRGTLLTPNDGDMFGKSGKKEAKKSKKAEKSEKAVKKAGKEAKAGKAGKKDALKGQKKAATQDAAKSQPKKAAKGKDAAAKSGAKAVSTTIAKAEKKAEKKAVKKGEKKGVKKAGKKSPGKSRA